MCLSIMMVIRIKTFKAQFMRKLSNTESELKIGVPYKKQACIYPSH